jgi:hypothetical protein
MTNASTITYYDFEQGANLILITPDANQSDVLHDLELDTKHSYYFTPARHSCFEMDFPVGILRPDWLKGARYLGKKPCPFSHDRASCEVWTKAEFIDYYADTSSCTPHAWYFWEMAAWFVTTSYTPNATAPTGSFIPPTYCNKATATLGAPSRYEGPRPRP